MVCGRGVEGTMTTASVEQRYERVTHTHTQTHEGALHIEPVVFLLVFFSPSTR